MRAQKKIRAARALFVKDSPFKPKVVTPKTAYKRSPKHKGRTD
jgi:hypothetical protein